MSFGFPAIESFFDMLYGAEGVDLGGLTCLYFGNATGLVFPGNPPYFLSDFLQIYPKFVGPPTNYSNLTITAGSTTIKGFTNMAGITVGQLVFNPNNIPFDAIIQTVDTVGNEITISTIPTGNDTVLTIYQAPMVPLVALLAYLNLALASIMEAKWHEAWELAICYFIAHYSTMYLRSDSGVPSYSQQAAAASGLATGIMVSQHAGDVGMSTKPLAGYDEFGAWQLTGYGQQFMTLAATVGAGAIWVK